MNQLSTPRCIQCGECCRKGGPLLHLEDMALAAQGRLPLTALVTLRRGELAYDPVAERLLPLEEEAIKLAGTGEAANPWRCVFHRNDNTCALYEHRPAQCRALFCTDITALQTIYNNNRATRRDLLRHAPAGWLDLAEAHEEQCALPPLTPLAHAAPEDAQATAALLEAVRFDLAFRELSVERADMPVEALPCVLGRPLTDFLRSCGLVIITGPDDALGLRRVGLSRYPCQDAGA